MSNACQQFLGMLLIGQRPLGTSLQIQHQAALVNHRRYFHKGLRPAAEPFKSTGFLVCLWILGQFANGEWTEISRRTTEVSASLHRKLLSLDRPHTPLEDLHSLAVSSLCAGRSRFTTRFILYKPQGATQGTSYFWRRLITLSLYSNSPYFAFMTVKSFQLLSGAAMNKKDFRSDLSKKSPHR